ncbi:MAG TPA: hypothetical protein VIV11_04450 [Kofleriaceae bacterium]
MKGDIAFVGFMMTADEWQELDAQSRAQLIAVATRQAEPYVDEGRPRRFPDGTGKHEIVEAIDADLDDLLELDPIDAELEELLELEAIGAELIEEGNPVAAEGRDAEIEAQLAKLDREGDIVWFTDDQITFDMTAQYDAIEQWLAFQPVNEPADFDEWVQLPPACAPIAPIASNAGEFEDFADWADL